jgi:Alginate lyase
MAVIRVIRFAVLVTAVLILPIRAPAQTTNPRVYILDAKQLTPDLVKLERDARKALKSGPFSVTDKAVTPPSGDKHDYLSQAPYFWPDPNRPDGLPYIRRDGERNPEIEKITDHRVMDQMVSSVETLALAWHTTRNEDYAAKAAALLHVFFLDPDWRMNPNLQFAQGIPGVNTGRGIGLIETRGLTRIVDAIGLLAGSKHWTTAEQKGMEDWFAKFLQWMLESKNGRDESAAKNNHGTFYDVQVVSFALFLGKLDLARSVLESAKTKRIAVQIEPDGRQPLELARTKSWSYSVMNLDGLMTLARLGENAGVDLWNYETRDGRSIRKALEFLKPFASGEKKWTHEQLGEWPPHILLPLIRRAEAHYPKK